MHWHEKCTFRLEKVHLEFTMEWLFSPPTCTPYILLLLPYYCLFFKDWSFLCGMFMVIRVKLANIRIANFIKFGDGRSCTLVLLMLVIFVMAVKLISCTRYAAFLAPQTGLLFLRQLISLGWSVLVIQR